MDGCVIVAKILRLIMHPPNHMNHLPYVCAHLLDVWLAGLAWPGVWLLPNSWCLSLITIKGYYWYGLFLQPGYSPNSM